MTAHQPHAHVHFRRAIERRALWLAEDAARELPNRRARALGNFPQAFTHVALISAGFNLDRQLDR